MINYEFTSFYRDAIKDDNSTIRRKTASEVQEYSKEKMKEFTKNHVKFNCFTLHNLLIDLNMKETHEHIEADEQDVRTIGKEH
jgi:hypothetical protein